MLFNIQVAAIDVEHRQVGPLSFADARQDKGSLYGRVVVVISVSVDDRRLHCSDENEILPAFVVEVGKLAG